MVLRTDFPVVVDWESQLRRQACFLAQLEIVSESGVRSMVASDGTWTFTNDGPIRASDIYMGENYDARLEMPGWDEADYNDARWLPAIEDPRDVRIDWNSGPPVRCIETRRPETVQRLADGRWLVDWGQNLVGWEVLRLSGLPRGTEITIRHGEMLNADGSVHTDNLRGARAQSVYYSRGEEEQVYEPLFTFYGFRYTEIENLRARCGSRIYFAASSIPRWSARGHLSVPIHC